MAQLPASPTPTGRDIASLALMPVTVANAQPDRGRHEWVYQTKVDGKIRRIDVAVEPSAEVGWPTHADAMVYLALLQLAVRKGSHNVLECLRPEVFELLEWSQDVGWYYERLVGSLQRLTGATVFVRQAMIARNGQPYGKSDAGVHLIDSFRISQSNPATVRIEWGALVREAFAVGDLKQLDIGCLLRLGNPLTAQLYRLLDRQKLSGDVQWEVGWRTLAQMLGMVADAYNRPAKFRAVLEPSIDKLEREGVLDGWEYRRGGTFRFHLRNRLRQRLREVLSAMGMYDQAVSKLLAASDLAAILAQADCLAQGGRGEVRSPAAILIKAVEESWAFRYSEDEPDCFAGLWGMLGTGERAAYHQAGLRLCESGDNLLATRPDPTVWPVELRAVVRFMVTHSLDPDDV